MRVVLTTAVAAAAFLLASSARGPKPGTAPHRAEWVDAGGGVRLRGVRSGSGTPVLLLHGYGESLISWRSVFDSLEHHASVLALDLPGFGLSSKTVSNYTTDSVAALVLRALTNWGVSSAVVVGHSLGGAVAAAMAIQEPARVLGVVLIDPAVIVTPRIVPPSDGDDDPSVQSLRRAIAEYELLRPRFTSPSDPAWLAPPDAASAAYTPAADSAYLLVLQQVLSDFDFAWLTPERASTIRQRVLVIWGEYDQLLPLEHGRRLVEMLPNARLEVILRSWHRPHVERPEAVAKHIVQFLITL